MNTDMDTRIAPAVDPIAATAIEWMVRLRSGEVDHAERAEFSRWCDSDRRHAAAVQRLEQALGTFNVLPAGARSKARRVLLKAPARRKLLRDALVLAAVGAGSMSVLQRFTPLQTLTADVRTHTGQRRLVQLPDGSELWLNARSAVDVVFKQDGRHLHLREGEIIITVARDTARPFIVHSAQGSVRALGTRFLVRQEADDTLLAVLHSAVRVDTRSGSTAVFNAGESARFTAQGIESLQLSGDVAAWTDGFIEVHDRPLRDVIAALRPYRAGVLRCSPAAGALHVTGTFPLDDSERALLALAETLPISLQRRTNYWVSIDLR